MSVTLLENAAETQNAMVLYNSILETGNVTFLSEEDDGAGLNCVEDTTFDFWTPTLENAAVIIDMGEDTPCDALGIAAHNVGTSGGSVSVDYSDDGSTWTTVGEITPTTDDTILAVFDLVWARYWRVTLNDATPSIGVLKLGQRLIMPCGVLSGHTGINHSKRSELLTNESIRGQYLGTRVQRVGADTSIDFGLVSTDFVDNDMAEFEEWFDSGRTFFYAGSPDNWPDDYGYCWRSGNELRPSYEEGGELASVSMDVSIYVE